MWVVGLMAMLCGESHAAAVEGGYAIVVSRATHGDGPWRRVVDALVAKHAGRVVVYDGDVRTSLGALREAFPRYTCFVATPGEATREFVAAVHGVTRRYDGDPYADTIWGILTGFDADNALRIAQQAEPLVVRKVAAGTEVALELCEEGVWHCELVAGKVVRKEPGQKPRQEQVAADSTAALAGLLNGYRADLFVTSGHATERDWQIGFRYPNGTFRSKAGKLFGVDTSGKTIPIDSPNPKVYMAVGNCLMGHIDGADAMALAWMKSAGVAQMVGYTVPTWYGYPGWGMLDYFVEQPGRYTLAEAFMASQHAMIHRLSENFPDLTRRETRPGEMPRQGITLTDAARQQKLTARDGAGLLHDRDVVVFYGDPAWSARMAKGPKAWEQTLTVNGNEYVLDIRPQLGAKSFQPINTNGTQRGGRPMVQFLPGRVGNVKILEGQELRPVVMDDFVLVPNPGTCEEGRVYRVKFSADGQAAGRAAADGVVP